MPGGPEELGFVYFAAEKFVGYTASYWRSINHNSSMPRTHLPISVIIGGIPTSFALDAIGILSAMVLPGGFSVF